MMRRLLTLLLWLPAALAALLALLMAAVQALAGSGRALRVIVAADQMLNAALGGSEDETISSRAGKGAAAGVWRYCLLCRLLDVLDRDHCARSVEEDEGRVTRPRTGL